jgi:hypothetical protein
VARRQGSASPLAQAAAAAVSGVSSFAFQGTNAHAVLEQRGAAALGPGAPRAWERRRHWCCAGGRIALVGRGFACMWRRRAPELPWQWLRG